MKKVVRKHRDVDYPDFVLPQTRLLVVALLAVLLASGLALLIFV